MSENLTPARCTEQEWAAARDAGLLIATTADEVALHSFAKAILAEPLDCLKELVEIVQGVIDDGHARSLGLDSFTLQPARAAIAKATA